MGQPLIDITGQQFGQLTAIRIVGDNPKRYKWLCLCSCGNTRLAATGRLRKGSTTACERCVAIRRTKHGHAGKSGRRAPIYGIWAGMIQRCTNPNEPGFQYYGRRGIQVCGRWRKFENFLADMGERPEGKSLDRYPDQNGNYEPGNVRWATSKEQANNSRKNVLVELNGKTQTISQWADELGIARITLTSRLARGWSTERAFTQRVQQRAS